jgi:hypothetical protein
VVLALVASLVLSLVGAACSVTPATDPASTTGSAPSAPRTWRVPEEHPTIADATAAARPGDLILIGPGRYHESVRLVTPNVTVRGTDRNDVVLDGANRLGTGITVEADGVAVENLTVRGYQHDGVRVGTATPLGDTAIVASASEPDGTAVGGPVRGYRVAWVTVAKGGSAGVRVAGARGGTIDHVTASDLAGAGIAVSGCQPCDLVVTDARLQLSRVGFTLDGAAGVVVGRGTVRRNRSGIRIGSALLDPSGDTAQVTVVGLDVTANDNADAPGPAGQPWGDGIVVLGANVAILRNRVVAHRHAGIWLTGVGASRAKGVKVSENVVAGNGVDLLVGTVDAEQPAAGSCFAANVAVTSSPVTLVDELTCGAAIPAAVWPPVAAPDTTAAGRDYRLAPFPVPQETMPGPVDAPPGPVDSEPVVDLAAIGAPAP